MQEQSREQVEYLIKSNKQAIKSRNAKIALAQNPNLPQSRQESEKPEIYALIIRLRDQIAELLPFVEKIRGHVADITESTRVCAVYLLLCQVFDHWNSFLLLVENGKSAGAAVLLRTIKEALMTIDLFAVECKAGNSKNLEKWFSGDIITHGTGRAGISEYFSRIFRRRINIMELDIHIYQMESQVAHHAYAAILEQVSPFTEDFDFDGYTGFFRAKALLRYAGGSMTTLNVTLKMIYLMILNDGEGFSKLDDILIKYDPGMNNRSN